MLPPLLWRLPSPLPPPCPPSRPLRHTLPPPLCSACRCSGSQAGSTRHADHHHYDGINGHRADGRCAAVEEEVAAQHGAPSHRVRPPTTSGQGRGVKTRARRGAGEARGGECEEGEDPRKAHRGTRGGTRRRGGRGRRQLAHHHHLHAAENAVFECAVLAVEAARGVDSDSYDIVTLASQGQGGGESKCQGAASGGKGSCGGEPQRCQSAAERGEWIEKWEQIESESEEELLVFSLQPCAQLLLVERRRKEQRRAERDPLLLIFGVGAKSGGSGGSARVVATVPFLGIRRAYQHTVDRNDDGGVVGIVWAADAAAAWKRTQGAAADSSATERGPFHAALCGRDRCGERARG